MGLVCSVHQGNVVDLWGFGITTQYFFTANPGPRAAISNNRLSNPVLSYNENGVLVQSRAIVYNYQQPNSLSGNTSPWDITGNIVNLRNYPPSASIVTGITVESVFSKLDQFVIQDNNIIGGDRGYVLSQNPYEGSGATGAVTYV